MHSMLEVVVALHVAGELAVAKEVMQGVQVLKDPDTAPRGHGRGRRSRGLARQSWHSYIRVSVVSNLHAILK